MSPGYKIREQEGLYFITLQIVGWVDVFTRKIYRDIVIENLKFCQTKKGLNLFAFVIMSNHIHLLLQSATGDLSGLIRDFKSYTTMKILEVIEEGPESRREWMKMVFEFHAKYKSKQTYQVWTHENHAEHIYSQKFIEQKINYIHQNPVRSGLVANAEDYIYSSARNYVGMDSLIEVIRLDFMVKGY